MESSVEIFWVTTAIGLFIFGFGLKARLGYLKRMFITKGIPGIYPRSTVYALMPVGVFFLSFFPIFLWGGENALDRALPASVFFGLAILVVVSLIWQPGWLKPAWLRWMEAKYGHVLEGMFEEARQMGAHNWEAQVRTKEDLKRWADGVAQKHGWQRRS